MSHPEVPATVTKDDVVVGGEAVPAESGDRFQVEFPYTGDVWASAPRGGPTDVDAAVTAAKECFESDERQSLSATDRGRLLFDLAAVLEEHVDELGRLGTLSNRKTALGDARPAEALPGWYRYYGGLADKIEGSTIPVEDERMFNFRLREPYGVVGAITPWNSPLMLATYKIAPAIAAGNTVVLKPSEITPVTDIRLAELASEAGWPDGALNVITGFGEVGAALTDHDSVHKVAFTGELETGRAVGPPPVRKWPTPSSPSSTVWTSKTPKLPWRRSKSTT